MVIKEKIITSGMLVTAALLFGSSYSFRKMALLNVGAFFFNASRFAIAFVILFIAYLFSEKKSDYKPVLWQFKGGMMIGLLFCLGVNIQQLGLITSGAGECGFITSLYILFTPIISWLVLKRKIGVNIWAAAVSAVTGLFLISAGNGFHIVTGDVLFLITAVFFAVQIIVIGHYITHSSPLFLVAMQMLVSSVISLALSLIFESGNTLESFITAIVPIIYTSVFTVSIGNLFQFVAQKKASPSVAAIILSLESVFAAIFGAFILHERMNLFQVAGCCLIFIAIILSQTGGKRPADPAGGTPK